MGSMGNAPSAKGGPLGYSMTIILYLTLNISLNLTCKYALGSHFTFPITLTLAHMLFSFVALTPVMMFVPAYRQQHKHTLCKQWKGFVAIGAFLAANIALNNISLVYITLTLNQIIRSSIPVITALMAVPVEGRVPSRNEFLSLMILSFGVMLSVWEGSASGSVAGIMFCLVATVSNAAMMTFSGKIMSEKVDALRLTWYTAPVSCVFLLPLFFMAEAGAMETYLQTHWQDALWIIMVTSANALAYNVVHYLTIQITSAVTTTVLGMVKIVGLLVLSGYILQEGKSFTPRLALGCMGTLLGFCMYSHTRLQAAQRSAKQAAARDEEDHGAVHTKRMMMETPLLGHQQQGGKQDA